LRSRLRRGEDADDIIELRLRMPPLEMAQAKEFDFVIINELFERAVFDETIVHAQRLKFSAQQRACSEIFNLLEIPEPVRNT
jgi:guanylate kinase